MPSIYNGYTEPKTKTDDRAYRMKLAERTGLDWYGKTVEQMIEDGWGGCSCYELPDGRVYTCRACHELNKYYYTMETER